MPRVRYLDMPLPSPKNFVSPRTLRNPLRFFWLSSTVEIGFTTLCFNITETANMVTAAKARTTNGTGASTDASAAPADLTVPVTAAAIAALAPVAVAAVAVVDKADDALIAPNKGRSINR